MHAESTTVSTSTSLDRPSSPLRSVGAVAAGLAAVVVLSTAVDLLCYATGVFPGEPAGMTTPDYLLAMIYRSVIQIGGGLLTARLAPRRPMLHVGVLAGIGTLAALAGAVAAAGMGPAWYAISLVVLAVPTVVAGGRMARRIA